MNIFSDFEVFVMLIATILKDGLPSHSNQFYMFFLMSLGHLQSYDATKKGGKSYVIGAILICKIICFALAFSIIQDIKHISYLIETGALDRRFYNTSMDNRMFMVFSLVLKENLTKSAIFLGMFISQIIYTITLIGLFFKKETQAEI